jgi:hypothetical protein
MIETLQEYFDSRGVAVRVDRAAAVIRGVKLLGLESRNGRSYLPEALVQAVPLYEDAKVNVNHPKGNPSGPRDYQDRIGVIRSVRAAGNGLFGDFHFNPKHALAEQLVWDAEHAAENVGFSHNVEARTTRRGDRVVVEAITRVQSVDLVADPATTRGLYESAEAGKPAAASALPNGHSDGHRRTALVGEESPLIAGKILRCAQDDGHRSQDDGHRSHDDLAQQLREESAAEIDRLRAEVARLTAADVLHAKQATARRLLREFQLPEPASGDALARAVTSQRFFESLLAAADEAAMREAVEERARLVQTLLGAAGEHASRPGGPQSRDQQLVTGNGPTDAKSFVNAITG